MKNYETKHGDRSITFRFENGTDEKGDRCVIDVLAFHSKERKVYIASWTPKTIERLEGGFSVERFEIPSGGHIMSERTARYSQKGLDEFAARALATYLSWDTAADMMIEALGLPEEVTA